MSTPSLKDIEEIRRITEKRWDTLEQRIDRLLLASKAIAVIAVLALIAALVRVVIC